MILYHSNSTVEEFTPVPGIHYSEPEDDVEVSDINTTDKIFKEHKKCKLLIENGADFVPSAEKNQAEPSTSNHELDNFTFLKSDDIFKIEKENVEPKCWGQISLALLVRTYLITYTFSWIG